MRLDHKTGNEKILVAIKTLNQDVLEIKKDNLSLSLIHQKKSLDCTNPSILDHLNSSRKTQKIDTIRTEYLVQDTDTTQMKTSPPSKPLLRQTRDSRCAHEFHTFKRAKGLDIKHSESVACCAGSECYNSFSNTIQVHPNMQKNPLLCTECHTMMCEVCANDEDQ